MITESMVYWVLKLDDICKALVIVGVCSATVALGTLIAWGVNAAVDNVKLARSAKKICRKSTVVALACLTILTFIPKTKQMAMIKVIPAIANSEIAGEISKDAKELYKMGVDAIKEQLMSKEIKKDDR